MKTRVCFHDIENDVPELGYEFYMVDVVFTNTGESRRDGHTEPQHKNMSGEVCISGWLGTTDNIDIQAIGKFRVIDVLSARPRYFNQGVLVELKEIK